jgi:hypothetical protein
MIKTKMIAVILMAFRVTDKQSLPPEGRGEHRRTDLRWRTRKKNASLNLGQLNLSPRYYLKDFKFDISQMLKFPQ